MQNQVDNLVYNPLITGSDTNRIKEKIIASLLK
uniref:Uncharacterized protein n=1 Tax=Arundo donax TaxID=35708 RepID=A0A0A8Y185_ARUDO